MVISLKKKKKKNQENWLLVLLGYQPPWHWLCMINRPLSYMGTNSGLNISKSFHLSDIQNVIFFNTNQIGLRSLTWPGTWGCGICWVLKISTYCWGCPILVSMNNRKYKHTLVFPQNISACEWLTLEMLNCFKYYKICIHILYHILDSVQQKKTKFIMELPYMLPILYCQYHACWCSGDLRSQGISRHGIDQISQMHQRS